MDSRVRTKLQSVKSTPLKNEKNEKVGLQGRKPVEVKKAMASRRSLSKERKLALQQDVDKLKRKLIHEQSVHRALERAFNRPLGVLPRLPPYLPSPTLELLAEVAVLEEEVVRLEERVVDYRQCLYQEAVYISSSKRYMDNPIDLHELIKSKSSKSENSKFSAQTAGCVTSSIGRNLRPSLPAGELGKENQTCTSSMKNGKGSPIHKAETIRTPGKGPEKHLDSRRLQIENRVEEHGNWEAGTPTMSNERLSDDDSPNKISENILKCLLSIFTRMSTFMADNSPNLPTLSSHESSKETEFWDPYGLSSEFGKKDIGPYKHLYVIETDSVNPKRAFNCSFLLSRLKLLLGNLASVSLHQLSHQEKLAFWINIYNSCMMNGFLEYGIPESPGMIVAMMQKAIVNVGGHLLNAITIEHFILRLPYHSKYAFSKGSKKDDMKGRRINGLELCEPLVTFALSCGSWSSPAVRVYTACQVENELEVAKREYLQAAFGISTTISTIPKLLDWYLLDFAKDLDSMLDWICLQLPSELGKEAIKCLQGRKSTPLSQFVKVMPYDFSFRYLLYI